MNLAYLFIIQTLKHKSLRCGICVGACVRVHEGVGACVHSRVRACVSMCVCQEINDAF